jgi:deoxycytidylate deaminase
MYGLHAEHLALKRAKRIGGDTLIVIRLAANDKLTMAAPCKRCSRTIKQFGIKTIYFSFWDGTIQKISL